MIENKSSKLMSIYFCNDEYLCLGGFGEVVCVRGMRYNMSVTTYSKYLTLN